MYQFTAANIFCRKWVWQDKEAAIFYIDKKNISAQGTFILMESDSLINTDIKENS